MDKERLSRFVTNPGDIVVIHSVDELRELKSEAEIQLQRALKAPQRKTSLHPPDSSYNDSNRQQRDAA